jgi:predicted RNase H-like HicB family nuclease
MEFEGKIWKSKQFWLIEVPSLDAMTQGRTKAEAFEMAKDLIKEMLISYFPEDVNDKLEINILQYKGQLIGVSTNNNSLILALSLRRQREKSGSTIREVSERIGSKSPNAYAQYEKGRARISLEHYERLLNAANPHRQSHLRIS